MKKSQKSLISRALPDSAIDVITKQNVRVSLLYSTYIITHSEPYDNINCYHYLKLFKEQLFK